MTVLELKQAIAGLDDNMPVLVYHDRGYADHIISVKPDGVYHHELVHYYSGNGIPGELQDRTLACVILTEDTKEVCYDDPFFNSGCFTKDGVEGCYIWDAV